MLFLDVGTTTLIVGKLMHFQKFGARCYQDEARGVPTQGENGSVATDHPVSPVGS